MKPSCLNNQESSANGVLADEYHGHVARSLRALLFYLSWYTMVMKSVDMALPP